MLNRTKRNVMSCLPLDQRQTSIQVLFDLVSTQMNDLGIILKVEDFNSALNSLSEEQALVIFDRQEGQIVIPTQYGFTIYGTD